MQFRESLAAIGTNIIPGRGGGKKEETKDHGYGNRPLKPKTVKRIRERERQAMDAEDLLDREQAADEESV